LVVDVGNFNYTEDKSWFEKNFLHVVKGIKFETEVIGALYLKVSTKSLKEKIKKYLLTMLAIMLAVLLVSYFLALIIQGFISKPIIKLTSTTKMISDEADYSLRVEKPGNDEIGMLIDEYNHMLEQINIREEERDRAIEKLKSRNDKIKTQHNQLKYQKNQLDNSYKELNYINEQITSSIEYAQKIQEAVLPESEYMNSIFPDSFVIYKPKDIVSGDFYWMKQIKNFVIIVAADCTGHGVPGAFMSMMGVSFLNEIIISTRLDNAGETLDKLRKKVKTSLHQTGKAGEAKDGMDISICMFEVKHKFLMYAGAYNPLYMIRNGELSQVKGDRQPIAIHPTEKDFTNNTIYYEENDRFYMFSDGYIDQIGGPNIKKFKSKKFQQLILDNHQKPMIEQRQILEDNLKDWQGKEEQVDDILVIGIKV